MFDLNQQKYHASVETLQVLPLLLQNGEMWENACPSSVGQNVIVLYEGVFCDPAWSLLSGDACATELNSYLSCLAFLQRLAWPLVV